jgi:hypothetical protein
MPINTVPTARTPTFHEIDDVVLGSISQKLAPYLPRQLHPVAKIRPAVMAVPVGVVGVLRVTWHFCSQLSAALNSFFLSR